MSRLDPKDEVELMSRNPFELMTLPLQEFWRMPKEVLGVKPSCVPETGGTGREVTLVGGREGRGVLGEENVLRSPGVDALPWLPCTRVEQP